MTPYQGDTPTDPSGQRPPGRSYQQPPPQQPQPSGRVQGAPPGQPGQGGQPVQQPQSMRGQVQGRPAQGSPAQAGQPAQQGPAQGQAGSIRGQPAPQGRQPAAGQSGAAPTTQRPPAQPQPGARRRMRPIRVEEAVQADVVTVQRDTPIATVVAEMAEKDVGSVVVVDEDRPVGIITDRKVALALESTPDVAQKQAADLVGGDLVTGTTSMSVSDALQQLADEGIRRLPIVGDDGTLQGIVTLDDLLVLLASDLGTAAGIIESQSPRL